ncbi:hypothetical protein KC349_g151 [Hortaea werneckii]|nr:hypothetical protein KC349_g151 [Hortaea werneckii]
MTFPGLVGCGRPEAWECFVILKVRLAGCVSSSCKFGWNCSSICTHGSGPRVQICSRLLRNGPTQANTGIRSGSSADLPA